MKVTHKLEPIYDENSKVLILGTIPSINQEKLDFIILIPKIDFGKF